MQEQMKEENEIKRALIITTVSGFVPQFEKENVKILRELGYEVHYASNFRTPSYDNNNDRVKELKLICHQVNFVRSPHDIRGNIKAYKELRQLSEQIQFNLVHCHTPMGSVIGRAVFRKQKNIKILYTAHGFHFYKGAPIKNWLVYYPVEKYFSYCLDVLITINREDYQLAKRRMRADQIKYVPGVGVRMMTFSPEESMTIRKKKRIELGLEEGAIVFLSVGELNENKNHISVIRALSKIHGLNYSYLICGQGKLHTYLDNSIKSLGLESKIKLLGYRTDIQELYQAADVFVFPSKREGLSVALQEAMVNGLPVICTRIRGNVELIDEGKGGTLVDRPGSTEDLRKALEWIVKDTTAKEGMSEYNKRKVKSFSLEKVSEEMKKIYMGLEQDEDTN